MQFKSLITRTTDFEVQFNSSTGATVSAYITGYVETLSPYKHGNGIDVAASEDPACHSAKGCRQY